MKPKIFIYLSLAVTILSSISCRKTYTSSIDEANNSLLEDNNPVGYYHNEILSNFIEFHNIPSSLSTKSAADDFVKMMADYGAAVRLAYKNNPPEGDIDLWVGDVLNQAITSQLPDIINNIIERDMSATDAITYAYGRDIPSVKVENFLQELEHTLDLYGGSVSCENKITLLRLNYLQSGTLTIEERDYITWMSDVASGSYEYWNDNYRTWNPRLQGKFWDSAKRIGVKIVIGDVSGAVDAICRFKFVLGTPITWKIVAAEAAIGSIIGGVAGLLEEVLLKSSNNDIIIDIQDIPYKDIYNAYLFRIQELGI